MPTTPQSIVLDPQGVEYAVTVYDHDDPDTTMTAYATRNGATPITWPLTIDDVTHIYFATGSVGANRNATPVVVSALFQGVECASPGSERRTLYAQNWQPTRFAIELSNGAEGIEGIIGTSATVSQLTTDTLTAIAFTPGDPPIENYDDVKFRTSSAALLFVDASLDLPIWSASHSVTAIGDGPFYYRLTGSATGPSDNVLLAHANIGTSGGGGGPTLDGTDGVSDNEITWKLLRNPDTGNPYHPITDGDFDWHSSTAVDADGFMVVDGSAWAVVTAGTTAGGEPTWSAHPNPGDLATDGSVVWQRRTTTAPAAWQAAHDYHCVVYANPSAPTFPLPFTEPVLVTATTPNYVYYPFTSSRTSGTTGSTEPYWGGDKFVITGSPDRVPDGGVFWTINDEGSPANSFTINSFDPTPGLFDGVTTGRHFWLMNIGRAELFVGPWNNLTLWPGRVAAPATWHSPSVAEIIVVAETAQIVAGPFD